MTGQLRRRDGVSLGIAASSMRGNGFRHFSSFPMIAIGFLCERQGARPCLKPCVLCTFPDFSRMRFELPLSAFRRFLHSTHGLLLERLAGLFHGGRGRTFGISQGQQPFSH